MADARDPDPALRAALEEAAEGLLYTSESDRPFAYFALPGGADGWPYGADEFARRLGLPEGTRLEERDLDQFLARHIETSDPYDVEAQRIRPRYEALKETLRATLRDVRVFRAGAVEIACYLVGADGRGNLAGLTTTAIET
ncbi:MAG TPA: nuclease A inhibitor family protein [Longimicrobium sp.]|nr:nuclease A inhibitor family protein [Longimicrobium sp.]